MTPISRARELVLAATAELPSTPVPLGIALGRTLAREVVAATDVPPFENSAMDGFAVHQAASSGPLELAGESRAGTPAAAALLPGQAFRISTGAPLPVGADAVVPVEEATEDGGRVTPTAAVAAGQHVRRAGEDLRAGTVVLRAGARVGAAELGVAVGAGVAELVCAARPRVAILCTGDELREPGAPLAPGEIHNSNAPMLSALAAQAGAEVREPVVVRDDRSATERAFAAALDDADVVIASGGVSVGPHDHVKPALTALGVRERFWRVDLQPGKPTWFGTRGRQLVFGLPGNPVSSWVTFLLFARPALLRMQGAAPLPPRTLARTTVELPRRRREQALRVRLDETDGTVRATPTGAQGSHVTHSLLGADALAFVPGGDGSLPAGAEIEVERLPR